MAWQTSYAVECNGCQITDYIWYGDLDRALKDAGENGWWVWRGAYTHIKDNQGKAHIVKYGDAYCTNCQRPWDI